MTSKKDGPGGSATPLVENSDSDHAYLVRYNARRHLALYMRERNGLLIWKAFAEYRRAGLPVPENILCKLDKWAQALQGAWTDKEVAAAIEAGTIKRQAAKVRLRACEHNRDVMEQLTIREEELAQKPTVAARAVAEDMNLNVGHVKVIKSRWHKRGQDEAPAAAEYPSWLQPKPK